MFWSNEATSQRCLTRQLGLFNNTSVDLYVSLLQRSATQRYNRILLVYDVKWKHYCLRITIPLYSIQTCMYMFKLKELYTVQWLTLFSRNKSADSREAHQNKTLFRWACFQNFYRWKFTSKQHKNRQTTTQLTEVSNDTE